MIRQFAVAASLALCVICTPAAIAEDQTEDLSRADISGDWSFVANIGGECTFSGNALFLPTEDPEKYSCELTAVQVCDIETWQVRQTCSASRSGDQLVIISKLEEFVQGEQGQGYRPDNFKLFIKSADFMRGVLVSWGIHISEFHRADGTIS